MKRGGSPESEILHGRVLAGVDPEHIWGWNSSAGRIRVMKRVRWIKKVCALEPGINALECGCGTGIFTRYLAATGANITATDISPDLLERASRQCKYENVSFVVGNLEEPHIFKDNTFDVMYGVSVLHHLDVEKALKFLISKLKAGGRFAFSEPNLSNLVNKYVVFTNDYKKRRMLGVSPTEMAFTADELKEVFERAGYIVEKIEYKDFLHPKTPTLLIPILLAGEFIVERIPYIRDQSGSLWISGRKP